MHPYLRVLLIPQSELNATYSDAKTRVISLILKISNSVSDKKIDNKATPDHANYIIVNVFLDFFQCNSIWRMSNSACERSTLFAVPDMS